MLGSEEMSSPECGYVYIAYGKSHISEAINSAMRLKEVDPEAHITVITNEEISSPVFDSVLQRGDLLEGKQSEKDPRWKGRYARQNGKVNALGTPVYKKNLFFDTDVWFVHTPRPLFDRLEEFDICMAIDPGEHEIPGYSGLVPHNTGVLGYVSSFRTETMFANYRRLYNDLPSSTMSHHTSNFKPEQPYFMLALKDSQCKVLTLSTVWNARYRFKTSFTEVVRIIHGPYPKGGWEQLARKLNTCNGREITPKTEPGWSCRAWDPQKQEN